jgi:hypothetical protein
MNQFHHAVVVGINRYPGLSDLHGPLDDADRFAQWLTAPDGGALPEANVQRVAASLPDPDAIVVDPVTVETAKPVDDDIYDALLRVNAAVEQQTRADPQVWPQTRLYLFVAGHGIAPQGGQGALLTANASRELLGRNIELSATLQWYQVCGRFAEVVVFADCCRNYVPTAPSSGPPFTTCTRAERAVRWVIGYGASLGAESFEVPADDAAGNDPNLRRGLFTAALLDGLRNASRDANAGGAVSTATLAGYVRTQVEQAATRTNRTQAATIFGADDMVFGPAGAPPPRQPKVTITLPAGFARPVTLLNGQLTTVATSDGDAAQWTLELPPGLYMAVPAGSSQGPTFSVTGVDLDVQL